MRTHIGVHVVLLVIGMTLAPSMASGQTAAEGSRSLARVAADHAARQQADRQTVLNVLDRQEVRKAAKGAGVPIEKAAAAVATLEGEELARIVEQARRVEDALAGGGLGMTLAMTMVVLVLLFVLLIPLVALGSWK